MVLTLLVGVSVGVFGLPRQLGDPHVDPQGPTARFTRQVAQAPIDAVRRHSIVLARAGAPIEVEVDATTPIFIHGKLGRLADLHAGQQVRVSYDAVEGPPRANWIELVRSHP